MIQKEKIASNPLESGNIYQTVEIGILYFNNNWMAID